jgi:hypothetical protein
MNLNSSGSEIFHLSRPNPPKAGHLGQGVGFGPQFIFNEAAGVIVS